MYAANALGANDFTGFIWTQNAMWDVAANEQWIADDAAIPSAAMRIGTSITTTVGLFSVSTRMAAEPSPWVDGSWSVSGVTAQDVFEIGSGGSVSGPDFSSSVISGFRRLGLSGTSDPASLATVVANALYGANILKAWAQIIVTGGVVTLGDSFGLDALPTITATYIQVVLDRAMANTGYVPVVTCGNGAYYAITTMVSTTTFRITMYNAAGALQDPTAVDMIANVQVCGRHA